MSVGQGMGGCDEVVGRARLLGDNPAWDAIYAALPKTGTMRKHHCVLPFSEIGAALDKVKASDAYKGTA